MARAMGCSEAFSTAAANRSTSSFSKPTSGCMLLTDMMPVVIVPVLSITMVVIFWVCSSTSGPLISNPIWAPRPVPTSRAVGVASPKAQGQAIISTATAAVNASANPWPNTKA